MALPATENFAGAAGALSGSWSQQAGTTTVNRDGSGLATANNGATDAMAFWNADVFNADHFSQWTVKSFVAFNKYVEIGVRMSNAASATRNGYLYFTSGTGDNGFQKYVNGTVTALSSTATSFAVNDVLKLQVVGTLQTAFKNGVSAGTQSDASLSSGSPGISFFDVATADDWTGDNIGGSSPAPVAAPMLSTAMRPVNRIIGRVAMSLRELRPPSQPAPPAGTAFTISLTGSITPTGAITKAMGKPLAGSVAPAGAIAKLTAKNLVGAVGMAATVVKQTAKALAGAIASSGALRLTRVILLALGGTMGLSGTMVRMTGKALSGSVGLSGSIRRAVQRTVVGTIAAAGAVARKTSKALAGVSTPSGALAITRVILIALGGAIGLSGSLQRQIGKSLQGAIASSGALRKSIQSHFAGAIAPSGALRKFISRSFAGVLGLAGAIALLPIIAGALLGIPAARRWLTPNNRARFLGPLNRSRFIGPDDRSTSIDPDDRDNTPSPDL